MSTPDFSTAENNQELANEVSCPKAMLTLMLQAMGQADAGPRDVKRWKTACADRRRNPPQYFPKRRLKLKTSLPSVI